MRKSDRIRALVRSGYTNRQIADIIGCLSAYVRATRQRTGPSGAYVKSNAERTYLYENGGREKRNAAFRARYRSDPIFRRKLIDDRLTRYYARRNPGHGAST